MSHDDLDFEPIRGLPEEPPADERILWQGAPDWPALARRLFKVRQVALYFALLVAWGVATALYDGRGAGAALNSAAWLTALGLAGTGLLLGYAWLIARTTVYTITDRRVVVRSGVALPISINLPFKQIQSAGLVQHADGTGDLPLQLLPANRLGYLHLWPNVRPWHFARTEPMLRSLPAPAETAEILATALAGSVAPAPLRTTAPAPAADRQRLGAAARRVAAAR